MSKKHKKGKGGGRGNHARPEWNEVGGYGHDYGSGSGYGMGGADEAGAGGARQGYGMGQGFGSGAAYEAATANDWLAGMPTFLRTRNTEQFLLGAVAGGAVAWVLSDAELRGRIVRSAVRLYTSVAGGFEEMKEQMADIRAEVAAERYEEG